MTSITYLDSPLGRMLATAEGGSLTGLYFVGQQHYPGAADNWCEDAQARPFGSLRQQLNEYFAGTRRSFELPLDPGGAGGTPFQRAVWRAIAAVPFGNTATYSALAGHCGRPTAARACGAATGRNPVSLIIPCHRIIGSNGTLTGYAGGLERKRALLAFEGAVAAGEAGSIARHAAAAHAAGAAPANYPARPVVG